MADRIVTMTPDELARYARAIVDTCLKVGPGDIVGVHGEPEHRPLVEAISEAAYEAGAHYVDALTVNLRLKRQRARLAPLEVLDQQPAWHESRMRDLIKRNAALVSITGESEPDLMGDVDPARSSRETTQRMPGRGPYLRAVGDGDARFCVVAWPVPGWAARVYPELAPDAATRAVAEDILRFSRIGPDDPADAWEAHVQTLSARARRLTELDLRALELRAPGTALDLGLQEGTLWAAARMTTRRGSVICANLPTEEVFTSPAAGASSGTFRCTRPLSLDGRRIEGIHGVFRRGRLVELGADRDADAEVLRAYLGRDSGGGRLGEVALLDRQSRIGQTGRTYGMTLLDENAASHIAFGSGFAEGRREDAPGPGVNRSSIHVDVMIGSDELEVTGVDAKGKRIALIEGGDWQI